MMNVGFVLAMVFVVIGVVLVVGDPKMVIVSIICMVTVSWMIVIVLVIVSGNAAVETFVEVNFFGLGGKVVVIYVKVGEKV